MCAVEVHDRREDIGKSIQALGGNKTTKNEE
jgi:hypothetical protein